MNLNENAAGAAPEALDVIKPAAEEMADFARVAGLVGEAEPAPGALVPEEPPRMDAAESMAGLLSMASSMAAIAGFKNTAAIWTPATCGQAAAVVVPVLRKYPWGGRSLDFFATGAGVEEIALVAFLAPVGFATWGAIQQDSAKPEAEGAPAQPETPRPAVGEMQEVHGHANG